MFKFWLQHRYIFRRNLPHLINIYTKVIVDEFIAHTSHIFPGNLRISIA